jgi:hypothetical protein
MEVSVDVMLPQYLQEYLANFMVQKNKRLYLTTTNPVGKFIESLICATDEPEFYEEGIEIILPRSNRKFSTIARNSIKSSDLRRLENFLRAWFDMELFTWVIKAERMGIKYETVYNIFLQAKGITAESKNIEALKKKEYRFRLRTDSEFNNALQSIVNMHVKN